MNPITIPKDDKTSYNDFVAGNPIQVRVKVADSDVSLYSKSKFIRVLHEEGEASARIVSDPLVVESSGKGPRTLSLIIEKADR
jgi:hypothetical protein